MNKILRSFRKYHRLIGIIVALPLFLTVITGMGASIIGEWFDQEDFADFLVNIHTLEIIHLEKIYPLLNGLGLIGLLVTGISMARLFKNAPQTPKPPAE